jgi:hypothetical protein
MIFGRNLVVGGSKSERCRALLRANAGPFNGALYVGALRREQRGLQQMKS